MTNYEEATDEILAVFNTVMKLNSATLIGYMLDIRWPGIIEPSKPDGSKFWARASIQTVASPQSSLSTCVEEPYQRRYTTNGLLFIQFFCPLSLATSMTQGRKLAIVSQNAYRGKKTAGGVWFKNVRINELPPEALFHRFNVVSEFEFDELY